MVFLQVEVDWFGLNCCDTGTCKLVVLIAKRLGVCSNCMTDSVTGQPTILYIVLRN